MNQFEAAKSGIVAWFAENAQLCCLPDLMVPDRQHTLVQEYAAQEGNLNVLKYLVEKLPEYGTQIDLSANNQSALRHAALEGHEDVVQYIVDRAPLFGQQISIETPVASALDFAVEGQNIQIVKFLVEEAPMCGQPHADTLSAFQVAKRINAAEICNYLEPFAILQEALTETEYKQLMNALTLSALPCSVREAAQQLADLPTSLLSTVLQLKDTKQLLSLTSKQSVSSSSLSR